MKKLSILLIVLMAVGLVAAGCGGGGGEEAEGNSETLALNVGTDAAYAPFEYKGDGDEVEGETQILAKWMHLLLFYELSQSPYVEAGLNELLDFNVDFVQDIYESFAQVVGYNETNG